MKLKMFQLLLVVIYISFISLGLPDSLLGSAWPIMYSELNVPISYAGIISMIIGVVASFINNESVIEAVNNSFIITAVQNLVSTISGIAV